MRAWIDIENPPQVQYLAPFKEAFEARGLEVVVSARDNGITLDLLRERGIQPIVAGSSSGASTARKLAAVGGRAARLSALLARRRPTAIVHSSRAADLAAWPLRIPSFHFTDYEHSDLRSVRFTRAYLVYPHAIDSEAFTSVGLRSDRLLPFSGLKEELSFTGIDVGAVEPYVFPGLAADGPARVLFRTPGEAAHYFVPESLTLALELLEGLAERDDIVVIYVPRYPDQVSYLERFTWKNAPQVLRRGVPFVSLLKAVDGVISSGGTMLREAAYLGLPAYSILRSEIGQVDRYLESLGRLTILESAADLALVRGDRARLDPLPATPDLIGSLSEAILERSTGSRRGGAR